jgi:hypothetical protein
MNGAVRAVHAKLVQMLAVSQAWRSVLVYLRVLGREEKCHHLDLDGPGRPPWLCPQCGWRSLPAAPVGQEHRGVRAELLLGWAAMAVRRAVAQGPLNLSAAALPSAPEKCLTVRLGGW